MHFMLLRSLPPMDLLATFWSWSYYKICFNLVVGVDGKVKQGLVSGVAGLAGVVWVSIASASNKYKVDNQ